MEKDLLVETVNLFPVTTENTQSVSKTGDPDELEENQALLDEAMAAHKQESKDWIKGILHNSTRLKFYQDAYHLWLRVEEIEPLLQILNDVRVGSWIQLGCPENVSELNMAEVSTDNARYAWAMEVSGAFEAFFLSTLNER